MANKKISQLESAVDVTASDLIQIVDVEDSGMASSGTNKKCTAQLLANELGDLTSITSTGSSARRKLVDRFADVVNVKDFGAVGDGKADDTEAIQAAISYCNTSGSELTFPYGNYKISGSNSIIVKCSIDFKGSTINANAWNGGFRINRTKTKVTYGAGSTVLANFNASTGFNAGTAYANGLATTHELNNSFIKLNLNQDFYSYRGVVQKRTELNKSLRNGQFVSPLKYDITNAGILATSIDVWPMEDKSFFFKNLVIDISQKTSVTASLIGVVASRYVISDVSFLVPDITFVSSNPILIFLNECCDVVLNNIYIPWTGISSNSSGFTYSLLYENSFDIEFYNLKSDGPGWGTTGGNNNRRVTFNNCTINRIDTHHPFADFLKIDNCTIGSWGITVSAIGDLLISNSTFVIRQSPVSAPNSSYRRYISTREDTGGFCDGRLIVDNCKFVSFESTPLFKCEPTAGNQKPSGSPIEYQFWNSISVTNCSFPKNFECNISPSVAQTDSDIEQPDFIEVTGCKGFISFNLALQNQIPSVNLGSITNHELSRFNGSICIANTTLSNFTLSNSAASTFNHNVVLSNILPADGTNFKFDTSSCGFFLIKDSFLSEVNLPSTDNNSTIKISSSRLVHNNSNPIVSLTTSIGGRKVSIVNSTVSGLNSTQVKSCLKNEILFSDVQFITGSSSSPIIISNSLGSVDTLLTLDYIPKPNQVLTLVVGYDAGNTLQYIPFRVPYVNSNNVIPIYNADTSSITTIRIQRISNNQFTVPSGLSLRYIMLGVL